MNVGLLSKLKTIIIQFLQSLVCPPDGRTPPMKRRGGKLAMLADMAACALLTVAAVYIPQTAFALPVHNTALIAFCAAAPAFFVWLHFRGVDSPVMSGLCFTAVYVIPFSRRILRSFSVMLAVITGAYSRTFGGEPFILVKDNPCESCTLFLIFYAGCVALAAAALACRGRSVSAVFLLLIPLIAPCLIIASTMPAAWTLVMLAAGFSLLLAGRYVSGTSINSGGMSTALLLVPVALLALLPALLNPPDKYEPSDWTEQLRPRFSSAIEKLTSGKSDGSGYFDFFQDIADKHRNGERLGTDTESTDLSEAGPQPQYGEHVMDVTADCSGLLYLRGASLAHYEDSTWSALNDFPDDYALYELSARASEYTAGMLDIPDRVEISTAEPLDVIYTTYFTTEGAVTQPDVYCDDSYYDNSFGVLSYSLDFRTTQADMRDLDPSANVSALAKKRGDYERDGAYGRFVHENYMNVPDDVRAELETVAQGAGLYDYSGRDLPYAVAGFVRDSATYNLNTPKTLEGEDFVLWFLEHSHQGYCVHYASATALLLRVMGVPSRYVSGYLTYADANVPVEVTSDDAHAWVEYYVDGIGWLPLESTAPSGERYDVYSPPQNVEVDESDTEGDVPEVTSSDTSTAEEPTTSGSDGTTGAGEDGSDEGGESPDPGDEDGSGAPGDDENDDSDDKDDEDDEQSDGKSGKKLLRVLLPLLIVAALVGAAYARREITLRLRQRAYSAGGDPCAVQLWRECERLNSRLEEKPDRRMLTIAQKAAFSPRAVSDDELDLLFGYRDVLADKRASSIPVWKRLFDRYITVLY